MTPRPPSPAEAARTAAAHLTYRLDATPRLAVVLGSGLGAFADNLQDAHPVAYADIPHFPVPTAPGHAGRLVFGFVQDVPVVVMQGRVHLYEGFPVDAVTFGVHLFAALGATALLLTTASGGIHPHHEPGDFMVIEDQLNLQGVPAPEWLRAAQAAEPSAGLPHGRPPIYSPRLVQVALDVARRRRMGGVHRGVFVGLSGPTYETPAEIQMLKRLGGDAVSMSTVWEAIVGQALGLEVAGVSVIANKAAGLHVGELNHVDVLAVMQKAAPAFVSYLNELVPALDGAV